MSDGELMKEHFTAYRPIPPGEILRDEMDARRWTEEDLANISEISIVDLRQILNGMKVITPDIAVLLSAAFGTSSELWINLQTCYMRDLYEHR